MRCRIANELLGRGCNVILHGRNVSKLESVQREFEVRYPGGRTELFVYDASHLDGSSVGALDLHSALARLLKGRRLTILVNNVGHTSAYETVVEHSPEEMDIVMSVSMRFMTHVTRAALPHLLDQTPALIINVTGLTARFPAPFLAIHSGAKAYIENFSRALGIELSLIEPKHDVECIAVDVHNVSSNSNSSEPSFFTYVPSCRSPWQGIHVGGCANAFALCSPTAEREGRAIVDVVGCGKRVVTAYWTHDLMAKALAILPRSVMDHAMAASMVKMRQRELEVHRERKQKLTVDTNNGVKLVNIKNKEQNVVLSGIDAELPTPTMSECRDDRRYARSILAFTARFIPAHLSPLPFG